MHYTARCLGSWFVAASVGSDNLARSAPGRIMPSVKMPPLIAGRFVARDNRFRVRVELPGGERTAYLPNTGRLGELLVRGRSCWVAPVDTRTRKTHYDLKLVRHAGTLVSVDAHLPNALVAEALAEGCLEPFEQYADFKREVRLGESRLDFRLDGAANVCWMEVKSVTLVEGGVARFPDAPTVRGARHVRELAQAAAGGARAAVVFVVQRDDACCFEPHDAADPEFAAALREAARQGVAVCAWTCQVGTEAIWVKRQIPTHLDHGGGIDASDSS